ncbi:MAG: hypothetical protein ISS43_04935 [Candidatus Omnitrophica bacterium]|nr:hypothetical protein [Candidatus Omnitrophota bacterium]
MREAKAVQSTANYNEIRFTVDEGGSDAYYIYYLYNGSDSYVPPPAFDQDYYELRKATLSGDISGTFTYGSGRIIIQADANGGVLPPTTSDLSFDGIITTIDLSVTRWDETIRSRTEVKPSNLQVPSISSGSYLATTIYGGTMCTLYWSTDVPSDGTFHIWNAGSPELYKASAVATDSNGGILHTVNWVAPSGWPTGSYYYYVQSDGVPGEGRRTTISSAPPP